VARDFCTLFDANYLARAIALYRSLERVCDDFTLHAFCMDDRSFEINDEITLGIMDTALARELEAIFERDLEHCVELELTAWRQRGRWHRLKDNALYLFNEMM